MLRKVLTIGMVGIVALFAVPITPALAEEPSVGPATTEFQALSRLPDARRVELTVMTEQQLSAVEGTAFACFVCVNSARVLQANTGVFTFKTLQSNTALVIQGN